MSVAIVQAMDQLEEKHSAFLLAHLCDRHISLRYK